MEYEELLEEAYGRIKPVNAAGDGERFEVPKIEGHFEGKKTVLTNFFAVSSHLRRSSEHFQKFLLKGLAVSGQRENDRLILNNRIPSVKINQKIGQYAKEFVTCKECGKPDTEILKEDRISFIHCLACGAKHSVRGNL